MRKAKSPWSRVPWVMLFTGLAAWAYILFYSAQLRRWSEAPVGDVPAGLPLEVAIGAFLIASIIDGIRTGWIRWRAEVPKE